MTGFEIMFIQPYEFQPTTGRRVTGSLVFDSRPTGFPARPGPGGQAVPQRLGAETRTLYRGRLSHRISPAREYRPPGTARYLVRGGNRGTLPGVGKLLRTGVGPGSFGRGFFD